MNNYEEQKREITERNEKNKSYHKRCKIFLIGLCVPWVVSVVLAIVLDNLGNKITIDAETALNIYIVAPFVVWVLWLIIGIFLIRCPHCGGFLNRVPNNAKYCPHCATILKVYPDFEDPEL